MRWCASGLLVFALAGCGGGGGSRLPLPAPAPSAPARSASTATANFSIAIPAKVRAGSAKRGIRYVSASTLSGSLTQGGTSIAEIDLSSSSTLCVTNANGSRNCTVAVGIPIGTNTYSLTLYDGPISGGVHSGNPLSTAANFSVTVAEGQSNVTVPIVLSGIPAAIDIASVNLQSDVANTASLTVTAYDAQGNIIAGPGDFADSSGATTTFTIAPTIALSQVTLSDATTSTSGTSITYGSPSDTATISLALPADVIGVPFTVTRTTDSVRIPAKTSQAAVPTGTITPSTDGTLGGAGGPDQDSENDIDPNVASGLPANAIFLIADDTQSGTGTIGYYVDSGNAPNNTTVTCSFSGTSGSFWSVAAVPGGVVAGSGTLYPPITAPWGLAFLSAANFTACPANPTFNNQSSFIGIPTALGYDATTSQVLESTNTGGGAFLPQLYYSTLPLQNSSGQLSVLANPLIGIATLNDGKNHYGVDGVTNNLQHWFYIGGYGSAANIGTTLVSLTHGYDDKLYLQDSGGKQVYTYDGTTATAFGPAITVITPTGGPHSAVEGPDGNVYVGGSNDQLAQVTASGQTLFNLSSINGSIKPFNFVVAARGYVYTIDTFNSYVYRLHK